MVTTTTTCALCRHSLYKVYKKQCTLWVAPSFVTYIILYTVIGTGTLYSVVIQTISQTICKYLYSGVLHKTTRTRNSAVPCSRRCQPIIFRRMRGERKEKWQPNELFDTFNHLLYNHLLYNHVILNETNQSFAQDWRC